MFTTEDLSHIPDLGTSPHPDIPDPEIAVAGVRKLLDGLKVHKAAGPDRIPARILKEAAAEIAPILTTIFNTALAQGQVPRDWKEAEVVPIFKKGQRYSPANYRPVSLTSICCKLQEHILASNIMTHLENSKILIDSQHGFWKNRSTETELLLTSNDFLHSLDKGKQTDAAIMDFSKAFDKVLSYCRKYHTMAPEEIHMHGSGHSCHNVPRQ